MNRLITLFLSLFAVVAAWGAKADPRPTIGKLVDGRTLTVYFHGDEYFSWYTDSASNVLTLKGNCFAYAGITEEQLLSQTAFTRANNARRRIQMGSSSPSYFPHEGQPKALVVLVQFPNRKFTLGNRDSVKYASDSAKLVMSTKEVFDQYLNAEDDLQDNGFAEDDNVGSVRQYFEYCSNGTFLPQFDVVGPVTVSQNDTYYGTDNGDNYDINHQEMVEEACTLVDDSVDFSEYDSNGDGYVDLVYVIYAGYSQSISGNASTCLWPKSSVTSISTDDGVTVRRYGINDELLGKPTAFSSLPTRRIEGIGLFCHEFSHTMGLPDLYPTNTSARVDNQEPELWDLMDGGEYVHNGKHPAPYSPWEQEVFGWKSLEWVSDPSDSIELAPDSSVKVAGPNPDTQYLVLQNVPKDKWHRGFNNIFNSTHDAHGLLVWRINYPYSTVSLGSNPNNIKGQPGVAIVPADSAVLSSYIEANKDNYYYSHGGDLFPGTTGRTTLDSTLCLPNYNWITSGTVSNIDYAFNYITLKSDGTIVLNNKTVYDGISTIAVDRQQESNAIYTIDGRYVGTSLGVLPHGIYIYKGRKIVK